MNVQIIGIGAVGSTTASFLLMKNFINNLYLTDIDFQLLRGQQMDLNRLKVIEKINTNIKISVLPVENIDLTIICVGKTTDYHKYSDDKKAIKRQLNINYPLVESLVRDIKSKNIIVVTNPSEQITKLLRLEFPKKNINYAGDLVDTIEDGKKIKQLKGHTNWGIAAEVTKMVLEG